MGVGRRMGVGHPLGKVGARAKVFDFLLEGTLVPLLGTVTPDRVIYAPSGVDG